MLTKPLRFAMIMILVLFLTTLGVGPAAAVSGATPPPPPPPPGVSVNQQSLSASTALAPPVMLNVQQSERLGLRQNELTAVSGTVSAYDAATAQGNAIKTNFPIGATIQYVGWVNNGTGSNQSPYLWWYVYTPCAPNPPPLWEGYLNVPTGISGWHIDATAACAGTHTYTFWVWYNGVYTSRSVSYTVGGSTPVTYSIYSNLTNRAYVSSVTGTSLDSALSAMRPTNNGLIGYGSVFVDVGRDLGLNPLFIAALAAWQTGWGTNAFWVYKNNPFGYGINGRCSYGCALRFPSKAAGIRTGMTYIKRDYLVPGGIYYYSQYGPTLRGMNINYATDPNWKYGNASIMTSLAAKLHLTK